MDTAKDSWWTELPQCCKYDELKEGRHNHLIAAVLRDPLTNVERVDSETFLVYGPDEGLLLRPQSLYLRLGCELFACVTHVFALQPVGKDI